VTQQVDIIYPISLRTINASDILFTHSFLNTNTLICSSHSMFYTI